MLALHHSLFMETIVTLIWDELACLLTPCKRKALLLRGRGRSECSRGGVCQWVVAQLELAVHLPQLQSTGV